MNFQYLLLEYGTRMHELHLSITVFPSLFGLYTWNLKSTILCLIMKLATNLQKLHLIGFNLYSERNGATLDGEHSAKCKHLIDLMKANGLEVVCYDIVLKPKPFVGSFILPTKNSFF